MGKSTGFLEYEREAVSYTHLIECGEKKIVAKSVLNVMAAGIKCGTEINLICDGEDEEEAIDVYKRQV